MKIEEVLSILDAKYDIRHREWSVKKYIIKNKRGLVVDEEGDEYDVSNVHLYSKNGWMVMPIDSDRHELKIKTIHMKEQDVDIMQAVKMLTKGHAIGHTDWPIKSYITMDKSGDIKDQNGKFYDMPNIFLCPKDGWAVLLGANPTIAKKAG